MNKAQKRHQKKLARKAALKQCGPSLNQSDGAGGSGLAELVQKGYQHQSAGRLREAARAYGQVLKIDPKHPHANHLLGVLAYAEGDYSRAKELISKAVASAPEEAIFRHNLGRVYYDLAQLYDAVVEFSNSITIKPDNVEVVHFRRLICRDGGNPRFTRFGSVAHPASRS